MTVVLLLAIRYIPWNDFICLGTAVTVGGIVFFMTPVVDEDKRLSWMEKRVYKKQARYILVILSVIALFLWMMGSNKIAISIIMAIASLGVMLIMGKIKSVISFKR